MGIQIGASIQAVRSLAEEIRRRASEAATEPAVFEESPAATCVAEPGTDSREICLEEPTESSSWEAEAPAEPVAPAREEARLPTGSDDPIPLYEYPAEEPAAGPSSDLTFELPVVPLPSSIEITPAEPEPAPAEEKLEPWEPEPDVTIPEIVPAEPVALQRDCTLIFPLPGTLVGFSEAEAHDLRRALSCLGVTCDAEYADVNAAVAAKAAVPEPKRLLLWQLRSDRDIHQLERLNNAFTGWPILVFLDAYAEGTAALVLQAMRAGAAQVVLLPARPEDLGGALDRIVRQFGLPTATSTVIAVTGATGGCGVTTLAINLAAEIAQVQQLPCILIELALRMAKLAVYLDLEPRLTTYDLVTSIDTLDLDLFRRALVPAGPNLHVLAGPYRGIPKVSELARNAVRLIEYARRLASAVVLDVPYTQDELYFDALSRVDHLVLVGEQNVPSVHALRMLRNSLQNAGVTVTPHVLINRYDARLSELSTRKVAELVDTPHLFTVANEWLACSTALNNGQVLRQAAPRARAVRDIDAVAASLLGPAPAAPPPKPLFGFLRRWLPTA